jgi:hypothetical protein
VQAREISLATFTSSPSRPITGMAVIYASWFLIDASTVRWGAIPPGLDPRHLGLPPIPGVLLPADLGRLRIVPAKVATPGPVSEFRHGGRDGVATSRRGRRNRPVAQQPDDTHPVRRVLKIDVAERDALNPEHV